MKVEFRQSNIDDVEKIINLCNECFNESTDIEKAKKIFKENENDSNSIYLVGILDNNVIAHSKITIIHTMYEPMGTYSILNHVCVKPEYRRHDIATQMLEEITKICTLKNVMLWNCWSINVRYRRF